MTLELKVIPVIQVLICLIFQLSVTFLLPQLSYLFTYSLLICIVIFTVAVVIAFKAILDFRQSDTTVNPTTPEKTSTVVNSGIYAHSRNPMYLAMLLGLIASACLSENLLSFLALPAFYFYISKFQILPEEQALAKHFGDDYRNYQEKVGRWL